LDVKHFTFINILFEHLAILLTAISTAQGKLLLSLSIHMPMTVFLLPHSEDRMILPSFTWTGYQHVTDGRTDGQTDGIAVGITALCITSNAAAL